MNTPTEVELQRFMNTLQSNGVPEFVLRAIHLLLRLKLQDRLSYSQGNGVSRRQRPSSYKNWTKNSVDKLTRLAEQSKLERGVIDWAQVESHFQGTGRTKRALISKYNSLRRQKT